MSANATLHIEFPSTALTFPVEWSDVLSFPEGKNAADGVFFGNVPPAIDAAWLNGDLPEMHVVLDTDFNVRCQCAFEEVWGAVYPLRALTYAKARAAALPAAGPAPASAP